MSPKVSVILTHHLAENRPYLNLALKSLENSLDTIPFDVFLMDSSGAPDTIKFPSQNFSHIKDVKLDTATKKVNLALDMMKSSPSTHILHLSDDVILAKDCIKNLYSHEIKDYIIQNPLSNSDSRSLFLGNFNLPNGKFIYPDMEITDFSPEELDFLMKERCHLPIFFQVPQVSFYCTMIPRSLYEKIGPLDEKLEYRCNDVDFCWRAKSMCKVFSYINMLAFAFHFGSKTLNKMDPNKELGDQALIYFNQKWNLK